jgi:hypothetical protein
MKSKFDILINSFLKEQEIVANAEDANVTTSYDVILNVVKRMIEDPRKLLPPVDTKKFIKTDDGNEKTYKFEWRYGKDIFVEIKVTDENIYIYDIKNDKLIYSTPTQEAPVHEVQNSVFTEIEKLIAQDDKKQELGVEAPLELGDTNKSSLPGAEREPNKNSANSKTSEYLKALKK